MKPLSILLVDDDPSIQAHFPQYFSAADDLSVVGVVTNGAEAIAWLSSNTCDIVLSDLQMPEVDGIGLLRWIKALDQPPVFIAITAFDTDHHLITCLAEGAAGYVIKSQRPSEVVEAIRAAANGNVTIAKQSSKRMLRWLQTQAARNSREQNTLSEEDRAIILMISNGLTNRQIATQLNYAEITIKKKVSALLREYGMQNRAELATLATKFA